jgi:membrane protease YdiL (CAAX protease family)
LLILLLKLRVDIGFPLNFRNFIGRFLFQILISGTSEEIMFRALVITTMIYFWRSFISKEKQLCISVILFSTLIFMFDHINFSLFPLRIIHFDILQQLTTLIFGVFYGYLLLKTKCIIGSWLPIIY